VDASLVVSVVAIAIAAGSFALAARADRRASRAESAAARARLAVEPLRSQAGGSGRRFELRVRNVGAAIATAVRVWLEDEAGRPISTVAGGDALVLAPGDETVVSVVVSDAALPPPPVAFPVVLSWIDAAGAHDRHDTGVTAST
jgi:hypothetical protein